MQHFNVGVYNPGYDKQDYLGIYHYKSLINAYALKIDSAEQYFQSAAQFAHLPAQ